MEEPLSEQLLREYLLGVVAETQQEVVELAYLTDQRENERLAIAEEELIDDYLDQSLTPAEKDRFEQYFLASEHRKQHLAITRALRTFAPGANSAKETQPRWGNLFLGLRLAPVAVPAITVLLIALAATSLVLYRQNSQLGSKLVLIEQHQTAVPAPAAAPLQVASLPSGLPTPIPLQPGLTRGVGDVTTQVRVPAGVGALPFALQIADQHYSSYRVLLRTAEGEELWSHARLQMSGQLSETAIHVSVPASILTSGDYQFFLFGKNRDGKRKQLASFNFRVPIQ